MITIFVFMALSRGTFSALSPVMAAQQEERKRRESIGSKTDAVVVEDAVVPEKPRNPRRHSDSPYHTMSEIDLRKSTRNSRTNSIDKEPRQLSRHASNDSIKATNELLQKKLDDLLLEQEQESRQSSLLDPDNK
jgi:hypothetical protein